jgi:hypothetical protein
MAVGEFRSVVRWRVFGTIQEVADVFANLREFPRWWPSAFLGIEILEPGDRHGLGTVASICSKGWISRILLWQLRVVESSYPRGFVADAWGDLSGRFIVTFESDEPWVNVVFDLTIRVEHPLIRVLPILVAAIVPINRRWVMTQGEEGLARELARRRGRIRGDRRSSRYPGPRPWSIGLDDASFGRHSFAEW